VRACVRVCVGVDVCACVYVCVYEAMKALGGAIEADERALGHADVQAAVGAACVGVGVRVGVFCEEGKASCSTAWQH